MILLARDWTRSNAAHIVPGNFKVDGNALHLVLSQRQRLRWTLLLRRPLLTVHRFALQRRFMDLFNPLEGLAIDLFIGSMELKRLS